MDSRAWETPAFCRVPDPPPRPHLHGTTPSLTSSHDLLLRTAPPLDMSGAQNGNAGSQGESGHHHSGGLHEVPH